MIPSADTLKRAAEILAEIERLQQELVGLFGSSGSVAVSGPRRRGRPSGQGQGPGQGHGQRRKMSPEARARIAAAAKARWARYRAEKKGVAK